MDELRSPTYGLLVEECARRGISRSKGFMLVRDGLLDTFKLGRRTYIYLDSLDDLPRRLAERAETGGPPSRIPVERSAGDSR